MSIQLSTAEDAVLVKRAYEVVADIPTIEPNDRNRLGYHVWMFLRGEIDDLRKAIEMSRTRFKPKDRPLEEVREHIAERLEMVSIAVAGDITE